MKLQVNVEAFKQLMKEEGLNQSALARKMGVSRSCISRYMNRSRKVPSAKVIESFFMTFPHRSLSQYFFNFNVTDKCHHNEEEGGKA